MNIEQFVYIEEVYKTGSISKASKICHVSIPAISQAISNLEEELDVKIFNRSRLGAVLTEEGFQVMNKVYEITANLEELKDISKSNNYLLQGDLNISSSPSMIMLAFKTAFAFKKDYPNVNIKITEKMALEIIHSLKQNKDDIGFLYVNTELLDDLQNWEYETLINDKMFLCVGRDSHLAKKHSIKPSDLSDQYIVEYSGINSKKIVQKFFENDKAEMNSLFESNQFEIIKRTISEGFAISFLNGLLLRNEPRILNGEIVPLPLKKLEDVEISYGWLRMKNTYFSPVAKEFLKYLKNHIKRGDY